MFDSLYGGSWGDPMLPRCVVANSPVMSAWLKHYFVFEWTRRHGRVLANCDFVLFDPFVNDWMDRLLVDHGGKRVKRSAADHPYSVTNLQWRIYHLLISGKLDPQRFRDIKSYLGEPAAPRRTFKLAGRLAAMFDQYQIYRHDVIGNWQAAGSIEGGWQGELWRLLIRQNSNSYAGLFSKMTPGIVSEDDLVQRFGGSYSQTAIFGSTAMPLPYIYFLKEVLGRVTDVDLFVLNPSREYWMEDVSKKQQARAKEKLVLSSPEIADDPAAAPERGHELLCSTGGGLQEFLFSLNDLCSANFSGEDFFCEAKQSTALGCLQNDMLNSFTGGDEKVAWDESDDSIQLHICHSARREVEVLHDNLLRMLTEMKSDSGRLQPYQIQVLVSDMTEYAPHIEAVFGSAERVTQSNIPFVIESAASTAESEVLTAFMTVCGIVGSRFKISRIADLLTTEPVLKATGLEADDLGLVEHLLREGNIRWGLNKNHRCEEIGIDMPSYMTWEYGLDRLLMGYAAGDEAWYGDEGDDTDRLFSSDCAEDAAAVVLGKLAKFIDRLKHYRSILSEKKTLDDWHGLLGTMLDELFVTTDATYREMSRIRKAVNGLKSIALNCGLATEEIDYEVVVAYLENALNSSVANRSLSGNSVVFCQLRPMNSHPAEVVCMLGLNDGVFPRSDNKATFDLMGQSRRRGDRSLRSDDRCAFLEAVVNARSKLHLSYTGRSDKANEVVPPSIVLQEMRDCLAARFDMKESEFRDGTTGLAFEILHHLNAIHPDYFNGRENLFSFSQPNLLATRNLIGLSPEEKVEFPFPASVRDVFEPTAEIELDQLRRFFVNPAKYYYRNALGVYFDADESGLPGDDEPVKPGGLESHKIRQDIMEMLEPGMDIDAVEPDELIPIYEVEGYIPLGKAGEAAVDEIVSNIGGWLSSEIKVNDICCGTLAELLRIQKSATAVTNDVTVSGRTTVSGEYKIFQIQTEAGLLNLQLDARPSGLKSKDKIRSWISHLFVSAVLENGGVYTVVCGYKKIGKDEIKTESECFLPVAQDKAQRMLSDLLDLYRKGQTDVLPFAPETSEEYSKVLQESSDENGALKKAEKKWGERKNDAYGRSEVHDNFMFHAFGEDGPMLKDGSENVEFKVIAEIVYASRFGSGGGEEKAV